MFDLFSGGGGSSLGASMAGLEIVGGAEMDPYPAAAFRMNFPNALLYECDLRELSPRAVKSDLGRIDLLLASPECTNHSCAKGSAPRSEESKNTALEVIRFARVLRPSWIILENVVHMRPWKHFPELKAALQDIGYKIRVKVLDSAAFGVPQRRRRLFMVASLTGDESLENLPTRTEKAATTILDRDGTWPTTPLFSARRARRTLKRASRALERLGAMTPFLLVYYGTDGSGGWQSLDQPLRTITTVDRFALVQPSRHGHTMRMLQPSELRKAMGFPRWYRFPDGTRRDKVKLLGNAVCPPVMRALVSRISQH